MKHKVKESPYKEILKPLDTNPVNPINRNGNPQQKFRREFCEDASYSLTEAENIF